MILRAACVPRICLTCRLGLTSSRAALCARATPGQERWIRRHYYASDSAVQSKEKIEALIRGKGSNTRSDKAADKHGFKRGPTPQDETESDPKGKQDVRNLEMTEPEPPREEQDAQNLETTEQEPLKEYTKPDEPPTNTNDNYKPKRELHHEFIHHKQLGIEALGKPVEALVIKNPNKMRRPREPVRMLEEEITGPPIHLQVESLVPEQEQDADEAMEVAFKYIDDLRPVDTTVLRMKAFDALAKMLVDGFLGVQLDTYLRQKTPSGEKPKAAEPPRYSWILKQEPQNPPTTPEHRRHLTPKQKCAIKIMQTIWNLSFQEHAGGFDRTQLWLRPKVFKLITQSSSSVLESLTAEFLIQSNKERITPSFDKAKISIYAPKSTIPVILTRLNEIVRSITTEKVSVRHVKGEDLLPKVLQELGRITKTGIQYNKQKAELEISWLADNDRTHPAVTAQDGVSGQTEGPADVVLRLLAGREMRELKSTVGVIHPDPPKANKGIFVSHQRERRSMSWRDKLYQWSRYVTPVGKQSTANADSALFSNRVSLPAPTFEATQSETRNRIIATFGHVLHTKSERMETKMAKNRRILSPVIPHPAAFKSVTAQDNPVAQHTAIILNFAPNPTQTTWFDGIVPEVCLRLPVDPDTDLSNFSFPSDSTLHIIVPWQVSDILLPSESVDVRLSQHRLLPLDINQQSLKDFLAVCEFNLLQGRLRTPSQTTFSIPARLLSAAASKGDAATVDIPYLFMGLEIHQAVEMEWQGHTLRYNSIEAGQHGGQRQELSLQAGSPLQGDDGTHPLDKGEKTRFLRLVEEIATGKHFSWHGGYQLMQERSDEKFSLDMMEQESAEEEAQEADESDESETLSSIQGDESAPREPAKEGQESTNSGGDQETSATSSDTAPSSDSTTQEPTPLDADTTSPRTSS